MKKLHVKIFIAMLTGFVLMSCEDYLDKSPYSDITEENIFVNFKDFQAFVEVNYGRLTDYNHHGQNSTTCYDDASVSLSGSHWSIGQLGDYWELYREDLTVGANGPLSIFATKNNTIPNRERYSTGYWHETWHALRSNNMALEKLDMLQGTPRQRELIEGQVKFFRAFFIGELSKWVGGLPYIKRTLSPNEQFNERRLTPMATMDNAAIDLEEAAQLLPSTWDELSIEDHPYQSYDPVTGLSSNTGRVTKGAAYSMKAINLLWAGSPLSNNASKGHVRPDGQTVSGTSDFDPYYMEQAAKAAYEVIKLAEDDNVYQLLGMDEYQSNTVGFNVYPGYTASGRNEIIFARIPVGRILNNDPGKNWCPNGIGGSVGRNVHVTENQVERYETLSGLPINDPASGYDPQKPYKNRDPRLNASVILPNEIIFGNITLKSWRSGSDRGKMASSYIVRKYILKQSTTVGLSSYSLTPFSRLAEMYLIYAEGVNEVYGPNTKPAWGRYTAVEALNKVRNRAKSYNPSSPDYLVPIMPPVNPKFTTDKETFRKRIWNERDVELAYEAKRFFDMRRWRIATLKENKDLYSLEMDLVGGQLVNFAKEYKTSRVFDEKHYWAPIPRVQAQLTAEFPQTTGW